MLKKTNDCWEMSNFYVITTTVALYGSHARQHNFQLLFSKACTQKIPGFMRICQQACSTHCCNTSKSLIRSEYTNGFWCPNIVRQHLNQAFGQQWTGCGGPVNWPAKYPDLNPLDFLLYTEWNNMNVNDESTGTRHWGFIFMKWREPWKPSVRADSRLPD
jgi:hypothetical protein